MAKQKAAPKFLNLLAIRLPPGGIASIGHRISGVLMFLSIPLFAWLFGLSLENEQGFVRAVGYLHSTFFRLLLLFMVWSLSHHLLAGIRHLLLDADIGVDKPTARLTARIVNFAALLVVAAYVVYPL
ncbi:succinate dehydrogenase subunit C [Thiogranum longum]|uniref:Succinate dehydrogenase cytochrome b556 subunit n=1 Tax=Thiogranum longum TaxID=1537524 RepID=A0A4R1HCP0_9GAMM|nr:succinate dehydrogenase, cytochrome b556 subunit [Thiogranum longum]TCK18401.1 succinate dehydrogenase subunit C [Thiogranum longum]